APRDASHGASRSLRHLGGTWEALGRHLGSSTWGLPTKGGRIPRAVSSAVYISRVGWRSNDHGKQSPREERWTGENLKYRTMWAPGAAPAAARSACVRTQSRETLPRVPRRSAQAREPLSDC